VGSGKTTLIRNMIRSELRDSVLAKVFNTRVDSLQLLMQINSDFGLETDGRDKAALLRDLNDFLIEQYAQRRQAVLVIDEAQNLSAEILEEIRMLSNLETDRDKLLQIILVGQPQLREILARPELLQLRQRIQINCNLHPLGPAEVREYIEFRLEKAGNRSALSFDDAAVEAIATYSRGIPRLINILCDYIMIDAFSAEVRLIDGQTVHELAADLSFEAQYWDAKPSEQPINGGYGGAQPLINGVSGQAKVLAVIGALNKRVESLEFQPVWDNAALLDLRDRMDKMELQQRAMAQELWAGIQQLRSEISLKDAPAVVEEPRKKGGLWKFLWGE
jgi:type II secretory pathway predicted ATPase ExeA